MEDLRNQSQNSAEGLLVSISLDSVWIYRFLEHPMQDKGDDRENILHFHDKKLIE